MDKRVDKIIKEINRLAKEHIIQEIINENDLDCWYDSDENNIANILSANKSDCLYELALYFDSSFIGCKHISHGVQSITFIFSDIVYKLTSCPLDYLNDFSKYCDNRYGYSKKDCIFPSNFIAEVQFIEKIKEGVFIYSQEVIDTNAERKTSYSGRFDRITLADFSFPAYFVQNVGDFYEDINKKEITKVLLLLKDYMYDFIDDAEIELDFDVHNGNWGFTSEGKPVIFDPFYFGDSYYAE